MGQRTSVITDIPRPRHRLLARLKPKPLPPGRPGIDRPKLVRDLKWYARYPVIVASLLIAGAGAYEAVRTYAGLYHVLTGLTAWQHTAFHKVFPVDWFRHLIIRDANEKVYAGGTLQIIVYNFASHWPRKAATTLDRIEGYLGVANQRLDNQGLIVLLLAPLWLLIYALPGELGVAGILKVTGQNQVHPPTWQVSIVGLVGSFIFGRRVAKGFAYHMQRILIREHLENRAMRNELREARGKTARKYRAAWWMLWQVRWRLQWTVLRREFGKNKAWKHRRIQVAFHGFVTLAGIALVVYLTWRGHQLLKTNAL